MKIGVLYICTGKYTLFWDDFYLSCEAKFMPEDERYYFVFTDGDIPTFDNPKVKVIYQSKLGWPFDTLKRFEMFLGQEEALMKMDYLFFFNANLVVKKEIGHEILPEEGVELMLTPHPSFYKSAHSRDEWPYDRNPQSNAYIPFGVGECYVQGGFNGGAAANFLKMAKELDRLIEDDLKRDVIALWHDESHLNRYVLDKKVKILHSGYLYPEGWDLPYDMMMMTRDKAKFGGHDAMRGVEKKERGLFALLKRIFRGKK